MSNHGAKPAVGDNRNMEITDFALECRHCANTARMEILVQKSFVEQHEDDTDPMLPLQWDAGFIYQVLRCYSCKDVTVYQLAVHTELDPEYIDRSYDKILYPCAPESPRALPKPVQAAWDAAMRVRKIDPNAFSVLLGRVLDVICIQENAKSGSLFKRIEHLAVERKFPEHLTKAAHGLRKLRNLGAHEDLGQLSESDAPLLQSLCAALLMHLYTVPALAKDAEERLEKLKE
jgi:hypothetical protein